MSSARDARVWLSLKLGSESLVSSDRRQYLTPRQVIALALERLRHVRARQSQGGLEKVPNAHTSPADLQHTEWDLRNLDRWDSYEQH